VRLRKDSPEYLAFMRQWVANGGPARAAQLRRKYGKPPVPPAIVLEWARYVTRNTPPTTRKAPAKPTETKSQRHARASRIVAEIDASNFVADAKLLMRGRKALANTDASRSARAFELSGDPTAFD
jgi:hypothetical protein